MLYKLLKVNRTIGICIYFAQVVQNISKFGLGLFLKDLSDNFFQLRSRDVVPTTSVAIEDLPHLRIDLITNNRCLNLLHF